MDGQSTPVTSASMPKRDAVRACGRHVGRVHQDLARYAASVEAGPAEHAGFDERDRALGVIVWHHGVTGTATDYGQ